MIPGSHSTASKIECVDQAAQNRHSNVPKINLKALPSNMKDLRQSKLISSITANHRWCWAVALFLVVAATTAGSLLAASDDAWEEFRKDVSAKMESAIAGKFTSHSLFIEPFGSESYGLAIASGVGSEDRRPLTVIGIYQKKTMTLEIIEAPETAFQAKAAALVGKNPATTDRKGASDLTAELLKGKWRHTEDKKNLLVFENNLRKESGDGGKTWEQTTFALKDHCKDAEGAAASEAKSVDHYISTEDDLCWHIDSVSKTKLSLTYVGRGNTLNYVRVTK